MIQQTAAAATKLYEISTSMSSVAAFFVGGQLTK